MVMDMLGGAGGGPTGSNKNSGYAATYYPGTPSPGRSAAVCARRRPGARQRRHPAAAGELAKITGIAVGSDGKPMSGAMVMLMPTMKEAIASAGRHVAHRQGRQLHASAASRRANTRCSFARAAR